MNLDFSKMKKISSDGKTATFQHPRGHVVKIALGALSNEHRQKIGELQTHEEFAGGGEVKQTTPPNPPSPPPSDAAKKISQGFNKALGFAGGGETPEEYVPGKDYREAAKTGSTAAPVVVNVQAPSSQPDQPAAPPQENKGFMDKIGDYAHSAMEAARPILGGSDNGGVGSEAAPIESQALAASPEGQPDQTAQAPAPTPAPAPEPTPTPSPEVLPANEKPEAPKAPSTPQEVFQASKTAQNAENQNFEADLNNGHITPETYQSLFAKQDTLGKIGTLFGLLISGAGSGLAHQPNAVMAMMDKQIDNDLNAQKATKDNQLNLLGMARKQLMDNANIAHLNVETAEGKQKLDTMALAEAKQKALTIAFHNQQRMVNKMAEGPQKEAAKAQLGNLYGAVKDHISSLEDINAGLMAQQIQGDKEDPSALVKTKVPQHLQPKVYDEIKAAQNTKQNAQKALDAFDKAAAARKSGMIYDSGYNGALHEALGPTFSDIEGTVRQAAMDNTFKNVTPAGLDSDARVKVRRDALIAYLKGKSSAPVAKGNGIDLSKFASTTWNPTEPKGEKPDSRNNSEAAVAWANAHPEDPRSKTILGLVKGR